MEFNKIIKDAITFPVKDKKPLVKNWNNLKEKISHENTDYGILCGKANNLLVIDLDVMKDKDDPDKFMSGVEFWNRLDFIFEFSKYNTIPTVETKSKGLHLYFQYTDQLKTQVQTLQTKDLPSGIFDNTDKVIKLDTLSDGKYVVGPGSKGYSFIKGADFILPPVPEIFIKILNFKKIEEFSLDNRRSTSFQITEITHDILQNIVDGIPSKYADSYSDWITVIWGIAETSTQNNFKALDIADNFSKKSSKYNGIHNVERIYNENKGKITLGTLIYLSENKLKKETNEDFYKELLIEDLNKLNLDIEDITNMKDESDKKVFEVVFKNNNIENVSVFKNNLVTTKNDEFKGHLQEIVDIQYDLSIFHPQFKGNSKGIFIDENTFDFVYKEENNGPEHRIRLRNPYNRNKSCFTIHSYGKQLGTIQRNKKNIDMLTGDAIAPACHKVLKERYNITVNCQVANYFFGNQNEGDDEVRSEEKFITDLINSHPSITDYMKFCNPNQSSFDGIYICAPQSGIWKKQHNSTVERMLTVRIKKYVPGLSQYEQKFIETQTNIQSLRKMFIGFIVDDEFESRIDENRSVFGMTNCVYDITTQLLRRTVPQDLVFTNTGWNYNEEDAIKYLPEVELFFKQLFPVQEEHDVAVTFFASLIHGYRLDKKFVVLTDKRNGNNGKSTLIVLLRKFFGDYTKTSNKFLLKGSFDKDKDSHDGGLEPLKGKRILVCDELKKNMRLDEGLIKNLAGGEYTVEGRRLGKANQFKFMWQAGIVMIFNEGDCPKFDCTDNAFMERLVVVPMRSKFIPNIEKDDEESFTYKCNPNIVSEFDKWKSALLKFFIKYSRVNGLSGTEIPRSMKEWKEEILNENNELRDWLFSVVEKDQIDSESFVCLSDLRDKYRQAFPYERSLKNKDIERMIDNLFKNIGVYMKQRHQPTIENKQLDKRNVYLSYKFK